MRRLVRPRLPRVVRLGLPAVALLAVALTGCSDPVTPSAPVPGSPTPGAPPASPAPSGIVPTVASVSSDGLTVRYLADDGSVKTVGVEDFPR